MKAAGQLWRAGVGGLIVWVGLLVGCVGDSESNPYGPSAQTGDVGDGGAQPDMGGDWDGGLDAGGEDLPEAGPWEPGSFIVGTTRQNRPMVVEQYGADGPLLLLISAIHGNERTAVTLGEQIRSDLLAGLAEMAGIRIAFLPAANPDGIALETRYNAASVDLNRNFPTENFSQDNTNGGPYPLSEPETQALKEVIDRVAPTAVVSVHCCIPLMDYDGPGYSLAQAMSMAMEQSARFDVGRLGSLPGSMGSYVGIELNVPIITLEFALDEDLDTLIQLDNARRAIEAAANWVFDHGQNQEIDSLSLLQSPDTPFETAILAESAGGLPIRMEALQLDVGPPVMLLAGLVDNDPRALVVAEHVRRTLLSEVQDVPLVLLTAPNPDGIQPASNLNALGQDVAADLLAQGGQTEEASALLALIEALQPRLVIHIQADPIADSVASVGIEPDVLLPALPSQLENLGTAESALADFFTGRGTALLAIGVHERYGRGDNLLSDYFPDQDPVLFSTFLRRIIKPGVLCAQDGFCDRLCTTDPDCACSCDYNQYCEAAARGSDETCPCDPDCEGGLAACSMDGHCDTWCPTDTDPDCPCSCNFNEYCEAAARGSAETCRCDPNCQDGQTACSADDHCDTWCPEGVDPDC
ncbi:MAG: DUF2817 domain-containing protein [Bradymonadales bacterium]|nr:DUF2817 domain-containing protein [Bradymonadales bacterium]